MDTCCICFEQPQIPTSCVPCGHVFCNECIDEWKRVNSTCPQCRSNIDSLNRLERQNRLGNRFVNTKTGHNLITSMTRENLTILLFILLIPFPVVYIDLGIRYVGPTIKDRIMYSFEASSNWTIQRLEKVFGVTNVTSFIQETKTCASAYVYDEISLISSIFQIVSYLYDLILQIFTMYIKGILEAIIGFYKVLNEILIILIPDLYRCISSLLIFPVNKVKDVALGLFECLKIIWQFVTDVSIPLGYCLFYALKVVVRFIIYCNIFRLLYG